MTAVESLAPGWFVAALAAPVEQASATVDGATVRARCWGQPGPGVVLVHGGGAHARWWDHVGPLLAVEHRVIALDLSGHGDSDRRGEYTLSTWADEVLAVSATGGITGRPLVVGHSMGGWVALTVGGQGADRARGVVAIDSPVLAVEDFPAHGHRPFGPQRYYATADEALARFRTIPEDPWAQPYIVAHVAVTSIVRREQGWTWKFDPNLFQRRQPGPSLVRSVRTPAALIRGEHGLVSDELGASMVHWLPEPRPIITIEGAGHHVMLDQPLALVAALREVLLDLA